MDALTTLRTRVSVPKLTVPAPSGDSLDAILESAMRAPDHGKLRPWRLHLIEGVGREKLGGLMADALRRRDPEAPPPLLEREAAKPLRAPLIVVVAAKVDAEHPKIPVIEQILAAGCAAQNIQLAAHALGFGCMWRTGAAARDPGLKAAFGLDEDDELVGFLYLGSVQEIPSMRPIETRDFVAKWPPK